MHLVSVVICTYNGSKYIETQLQSVINQTYKNIEIIIADDASEDATINIVKQFEEKHPQIKVYSFDNNVGYIKNFERGIALAKGNFIALCDQDDWWQPQKIEKLMNAINEKDLIYCDSSFTNDRLEETGERFSTKKNMIDSNNPMHFLIENCVSGHASIFRKELFEKARPFPSLVPHDWWLAYNATLSKGLVYFDEPLVKYRLHNNNVLLNKKRLSKDKNKEREQRLEVFYTASKKQNNKHTYLIKAINESYASFSLKNNIKRTVLFLKNRKNLLIILKKPAFKKIIFCYTIFFKLK